MTSTLPTLTLGGEFARDGDRLLAEARTDSPIAVPRGPALDYHRRMIQAREGADHVRLRKSVTPYFGRPGTEAMRPAIRRIVGRVLDELDEHEGIDFLQEVATKIPAEVYCHWVGAPSRDVPFVIGVAERINLLFVHEEGHTQTILGVYDELFPYR
jgi:cytochrome P450